METKLVKLGDIISLNYGKSLTKKNRIPGNVPVYGSSGITDYHDKPLVDAPSLIIGRKGSIGSVFLSEVPFYPIDTTYFAKESDLNGLDLHFAYYFLKFLPLSEMNTDSAVPGLNRNNFYSLDVVIPDIKSQKIIAFFLDQISYKIKINQQINKNLLQMMENCYRKMLKNAIYNHQSKQRNILTVADNIITGKTPSTKNPGYYGGDTPFITIPDMQGNVFVTVTKKRLTQSGTSVQQNKEIPALSLNVSCIGTVGLVTINPTVAHTNQQINSVIVSKDKLWELFFELRSLKGVMENMASGGTTILNMNKAIFSKLQINLLSPAIRKQFNAYANPIFEQILINDEQNHKLAKVRDLLLPKLLAGQIDLSNLEGAIQNA
ncbi:restriction endonuclease subunit S [Lactiplantibacillus plantarum]|uniref:restriction endonuclease subunit S n=1 Tax=Lactiplantibacillus plantarum TaxID=1590 RepID=UPI003C2718AE